MARPLVAIVGRPNVGKSMLFNRLVGQRLSIVEDTPGVTRDRLYAECEWCGRKFDMVDTGGIEPTTDSEILLFMREQAQIAIDAATVIILVTDLRTGVTAADKDVANMLLRSKKPVVLAVNKADSTGATDLGVYEFYSLGLGDPIPVSAVHGHGTGDLLDECLKHFPDQEDEEEEDDLIRVAIIGKPNVGKSSLVNHILGEKRVIVSDMAGTTRDAVDTVYENELGRYMFIDTAGIRRKSKVDERVEKFSVMRAQLAIERADVCLIMIDAREGVTEQDTKIAGLAHEAGKASIIIVNKWDLVEKETGTMEKMRKRVLADLSFMSYAPVLFISAVTGQRVQRIFELINFVNDQSSMRITTGMLNNVLADAQARVLTFPISATWRTRSARRSAWRARPSAWSSARKGIRKHEDTLSDPDRNHCILPRKHQRRHHRGALCLSQGRAQLRQRQRRPDQLLPQFRYARNHSAGAYRCAEGRRRGADRGSAAEQGGNPRNRHAFRRLLPDPRAHVPRILSVPRRKGRPFGRDDGVSHRLARRPVLPADFYDSAAVYALCVTGQRGRLCAFPDLSLDLRT